MTQPPFNPESVVEEPARSSRRGLVIGAGIAAAALAVGGGGFAAYQYFLAGGPSAATALPANTLAYYTLDLDPSAGQKIEALKVINKFPALRKELDLDSRGDLRKRVFELIQDDGDCKALDYAKDVEPWLGERVAVAALPTQAKKKSADAELLIAVEIKDEQKAAAGVERIFEECDDSAKYGVGFTGDYMLVSENPRVAKKAAQEAETSPLADDEQYKDAMDDLGDQGVMTAYVAPEGLKELLKAAQQDTPDPRSLDLLKQATNSPVAATVRFSDGSLEFAAISAATATGGVPSTVDLSSLPATTVAAFGVGWPDGWEDDAAASLETLTPLIGDVEQLVEGATGLNYPKDIATLLGDSAIFALDGETDFVSLDRQLARGKFEGLHAGFRIEGDAAQIKAKLTRLMRKIGAPNDFLKMETDGDRIVVSLSKKYASTLVKDGDLGDSGAFSDAMETDGDQVFGLFVDFNGDDWLTDLVRNSGGSKKDVANAEPLKSLGISFSNDDELSRVSIKLSTD